MFDGLLICSYIKPPDLLETKPGIWVFPFSWLSFLTFSLDLDYTSKSLLEALIFESTNPQYDDRLFTDLPVQCIKTTSSEHVVYLNCLECQNKKHFSYTTCPELVVFMY